MSRSDDVNRVAQTLTAIEQLAALADLREEAVNGAHTQGLPGGHAMAHLGPVANLEAWGNLIDHAEQTGADTSHVDDQDAEWEPALQSLCFWTEQYRVAHDAVTDLRPTISSEVGFLRQVLDWVYDTEVQWADFAADMASARRRLEDDLHAGERAERGAPCLYDDCGGVRLQRRLVSQRRNSGSQRTGGPSATDPPETGVESRRTAHTGWEWTDWHCPRCHRRWDHETYTANVYRAHIAAQREDIAGETWCAVDYAARLLGRSVKTIRSWAGNGTVRRACVIAGRRTQFVALADVETEHRRAGRRRRAA